jgi:hypothetical protein
MMLSRPSAATAELIEIVGGLFGYVGLGHFYAGNYLIGVALLIAVNALWAVSLFFPWGTFLYMPAWLLAVIVSPILVFRYCQSLPRKPLDPGSPRPLIELEPDWTADFVDEPATPVQSRSG